MTGIFLGNLFSVPFQINYVVSVKCCQFCQLISCQAPDHTAPTYSSGNGKRFQYQVLTNSELLKAGSLKGIGNEDLTRVLTKHCSSQNNISEKLCYHHRHVDNNSRIKMSPPPQPHLSRLNKLAKQEESTNVLTHFVCVSAGW